MGQKLIARF